MCTYIIHPVLVTFMYTCHHWFCQVVHNSHFHASTYPNVCITFHMHFSIRVLLVSIQWSIVNEHGHNTHTMHMVRDRFRLLDAIVDPPSSFSDLIHVYHYKRYPILLLIVNDTLRFWMICRNWMTLAGLLWAMIDWRSKRQRETPVIRVVDRENVQLEHPLHYPLFVPIDMITMKDCPISILVAILHLFAWIAPNTTNLIALQQNTVVILSFFDCTRVNDNIQTTVSDPAVPE